MNQSEARLRLRDPFLLPIRMPPPLSVSMLGESRTQRITVIVIHWRAPEWCAETIRSIRASTGIDVEILVVDNSADTEPYLDTGRGERILRRKNDGYTGGANAGLAQWLTSPAVENQEFVAVACHDAVLAPTALRSMVRALEHDAVLGVLGVSGGGSTASAPLADMAQVTPSRWVSGSFLVIRKQALLDAGRFDERFESYVEDVDFCYRMWDAGWQVARMDGVRLQWRGSLSGSSKELMLRNWLYLAAKRRGRLGLAATLAVELPAVVRSGVATWFPWRPAGARAQSRERYVALRDAVRAGLSRRREMREPVDVAWPRGTLP